MPVSVFDFEDYREFLGAWLADRPARSVRALANRLGVSPSYVSRVRAGKRNLKVEHASHWAWGMRLNSEEAEYFEGMVRAAHAESERAQGVAVRELEARRRWRREVSQKANVRAVALWYVGAVRALARCRGFRPDPAWVAARVVPRITEGQAAEALDTLFEIGALVRTADGGAELAPEVDPMRGAAGDPAMARALRERHRAWLARGKWALRHVPGPERYIGAASFVVDRARVPELAATLRRLLAEFGEEAEEEEGRADRAYRLGMILLPVAEVPPGGEEG